jgi:hypothetical protein
MDAGQEGESRRRLEAAYVDRQSSGSVDARKFAGKTVIKFPQLRCHPCCIQVMGP